MKWSLPRFAVFLAIALTLWLWPSVFGGKVLLPLDILAHTPPHAADADSSIHNPLIADVLYENYAWKHFQRQAIREGELPLWNPSVFCGHPLYATGQASTFYPLNVIFWVLPLPQAYVVFTWLHLFLGGLFMFLFCRRLRVGPFGAAVGGVCFALCGFFAVRLIWPMLLGSAIWLPLMLLWIDSTVDPSSRRRWWSGLAAGAVLFAMPMLSGFFEIAFYAYIACGLYTLRCAVRVFVDQRSVRSCAVLGARCMAVVVLAAMLAAPQLLPFFEVMPRNIRAGQADLDQALAAALEPHEAVNAIMPDAFGNPSRPDRAPFGRNNYVSSGFYLGLLPLFFALFGLRTRAREAFFFWLLLGLALALAFGTSLYAVFFHGVPGFEQIRTPFRWMFLATFAGCYLAAVGAQHWHDRLAAATSRDWRLDALKLSCVIGLLAVLLLVPDAVDRRAAALYAENRQAAAAYKSAEALAELVWDNRLRFVVVATLAAFCVAVAEWRKWPRRGAALASLGAITLIAVDLGQATFGFNTHADPAILESTPEILQTMQQDDGLFRVARYGPHKVLPPNTPLLYGLQDVGGYDSIILTDYAQFFGAIEFQKDLRFNIIMGFERKRSLDSRLLPLLNIRYLLASRSLKHKDWELVERTGAVRLYRVRPERALPRAFLVSRLEAVDSLDTALERMKRPDFDPARLAVVQASTDAVADWTANASIDAAGDASITHYSASSVRIRAQANAAAFLVLCDVYYPGWHAYVDGRREEVVVTNGVFRGVPVPAGAHDVEFRFEPAVFRIGVAMAIAALILLIAAEFTAHVRRRKAVSTAPASS